ASAHFHLGNGDASKVFINSYARSARDREVELPAGAIRTIHTSNANGRLILENETYDGRQVGTLRVTFQSGRITTIETDHHHAYVQAHWGVQTGQKDVIGEFNIGVNPQLKKLPGYHVIPYFGYGDGFVRISLGDNQESGGSYISSFHRWLFLTDATLHANHVKIMENGKLV
ncbi:MAG: hypothetical protein HY731_09745, partial [Candidatus Tectomicrobia bacterium]|nr:hypothetical protein [Candidatus Tectomicrobia bacterium]